MSRPPVTRVAGIVLCGGKSSRMGQPKAWLPFGNERLLPRIVRILSEIVHPIVVVAAVGQDLPDLSADVIIVRDELESQGPLAGLSVGMKALAGQADAAYATACDVPLLQPEFVRHVIRELGDAEIAIPRDGRFHHPLAAVYRLSVAAAIDELLAAGRLRPFFLLEQSEVREIDVADLRAVDPELHSLRNLNTPEEYAALLREQGLSG